MRNLTTALLTTTILGFSASAAIAVEPQEFMERFAKLSADMGTDIKFGEITGSAEKFTVNDLKMSFTDQGKTVDLPIEDVTVTNISEASDDVFTAEMIEVGDVNQVMEKGAFTMSGISMSGIELPPPSDNAYLFYENFTIKNVGFAMAGRSIFEMQDMVFDVDGNDDRTEISAKMDIAGLKLDLTDVNDANMRPILEQMGYLTLSGTSGMMVDWNANSGNLEIKDYFIDFDNVGRLTMNTKFDGYTLEVAKTLGELSKNEDQQASGMAIMGLMQQMNYIGASIRFEDKSLTNKLLDFQAAKQGTDRAALVGMASAIIPFTMAQLNKPEFTKQVSAAVAAFLSDPKSIEITANPAEPVPAMVLATTGGTQPQDLIDVLNVQVQANQ